MITRDEIQRLGELSALEISPQEEEDLLRDLSALVAFAGMVSQAAFGEKPSPTEDSCAMLRRDEATASLHSDDALRNASARQGEYFSTISHKTGGETT